MPKNVMGIRLDPEDQERIKKYLDATYKGSIAEFLRRVAFEKIALWEAQQREERRREEEHAAKLNYYKRDPSATSLSKHQLSDK